MQTNTAVEQSKIIRWSESPSNQSVVINAFIKRKTVSNENVFQCGLSVTYSQTEIN